MKASAQALCLIALVGFASCKKDDNKPAKNEEEIITTVTVAVQDSGVAGAATRSFVWRDLDGEGGNNPAIDTIRLNVNRTAQVALTLSDQSTTPVEDITAEIEAEKNEHQFFFTPTGTNLSISYNPADFDTNTPPKPLGLRTIWRTTTASSGTVTLLLKHQPALKAGINNTVGDATVGETDIQVVLPYVIR